MPASYERAIVWLRRDLRLDDNAALAAAAAGSRSVLPVVVLDDDILASPSIGAPLVTAFLAAVASVRDSVRAMGGDLAILRGRPSDVIPAFAHRAGVQAVYYGIDYEPSARTRDREVSAALHRDGIHTHACLDHVYFGSDEVQRVDGSPFCIFSAYRRAWRERARRERRPPIASRAALRGKLQAPSGNADTGAMPRPDELGFSSFALPDAISEAAAARRLAAFASPAGAISDYARTRNLPAVDGTSRLSTHLRLGTLGIRTCVEAARRLRPHISAAARASVDAWVDELIWRDFYQMILDRFPHVAEGPFIPAMSRIRWRRSPEDFSAWCRGLTGYPLVDAAMRQLNTTGWMHNRLRMLVASFLSKDLLLDWRLGERYFETHLADADLAANNGGWQWCASTGTDPVPYFRIFNPIRQSETFDPEGAFIRRMLPELAAVPAPYIHAPWTMPPHVAAASRCRPGRDYPLPIVDHAAARGRALEAYRSARAFPGGDEAAAQGPRGRSV